MAGEDDIPGSLSTDVPPPTRPRDQGGKLIRETAKPEPMFGLRPVEGDPETGDTSDAGDDPKLRDRERRIADGREDDERVQRPRKPRSEPDEQLDDDEPERLALVESDEDEGAEQDVEAAEDDDGEKYEVTVDGETKEVSLKEALSGYIRQDTFHKRMSDLQTIQANMEKSAADLTAGWQVWHKARQDYEEDLKSLIPPEPDWDKWFAVDPNGAHAQQKVYKSLADTLAASRQLRFDRETKDAAERDRQLQKYAVDGFARFVSMHPKLLPDEPTLKKNIDSMRRTAVDAGFSEPEYSTVFDPRMLTVLLWASKYRRMIAASVKAVIPGKGRSLKPGSATPLNGNAARKGLDEAQKRLQSTGRLDDAADFFSRFLSRG